MELSAGTAIETSRTLAELAHLPIAAIADWLTECVRTRAPIEVVVLMPALGRPRATPADLADDWFDVWALARWTWQHAADLTWSLEPASSPPATTPVVRIRVVPDHLPELATAWHAYARAVCPSGTSNSPTSIVIDQFRGVLLDNWGDPDEPFPDLRDRFAALFLAHIAEVATETGDLDRFTYWREFGGGAVPIPT